MLPTTHADLRNLTGNPLQPPGRHREFSIANGVGLIPLGDRDRCLENTLEDRDSDPNSRRI